METRNVDIRNNCLNVFKLIAALQVMFGHIITHLQIPCFQWVEKILDVFQGVPIFFTLSGFLIWFSIERSENRGGYWQYIKKRFWRIYPEMWVAIAVEIIVMCVLYEGWNYRDTALFTLTQGTLFQFWTPDSLRGYGCGTPNGALWTMGITIQFYIIAWPIYKMMKGKKWYAWICAFISLIIISILGRMFIGTLNRDILIKLYGQTILRYLWMFLLGMGAAHFFNRIVSFLKRYWLVFFALGVLVTLFGFDYMAGYGILKTIFMFVAVVGFAYSFPELKLKRDISFGIFIYHMTVVNAMLTFGLTGNYIDFLIVAVVSCLFGYISTITVGKFSNRKKVINS